MADVVEQLSYDPLELDQDPYPVYSLLRAESPVYEGEVRGVRFWALSRFTEVQAAARDWATFSSAEGNDFDDTGLLFAPAGELSSADPPLHTRLREVVRKQFGVRAIREALEPLILNTVDELLDDLHQHNEIDFAARVAHPLPVAVVCGWLGFPVTDHMQLTKWHAAMLDRIPGHTELPANALAARDEMRSYVAEAIAQRQAQGRDDLLTAFADARTAGLMSEDEALGLTLLLLDAGVSTTSALISSSLLHLGSHEDKLQLLQESPEMLPRAIEEFLRFDAPFHWFTRVTTCPVAVHDVEIPAGSRVVLIWASANRDERRWQRADELILTRVPQRHLSFGEGIHHCLGAPLARLEARLLFERLLPLIGSYEVSGNVRRRITPSERTIASLPVQIRWRR